MCSTCKMCDVPFPLYLIPWMLDLEFSGCQTLTMTVLIRTQKITLHAQGPLHYKALQVVLI
jgi:hypothetical protein